MIKLLFLHTPGTENAFLDVEFDLTKGTFLCIFKKWYYNMNKSCSLVYGPIQNMNNCITALKNRNTSIDNFSISNQDSVIISLSQTSDNLVYCFIAKGTTRMMTVAIEGTYYWGMFTLNIMLKIIKGV